MCDTKSEIKITFEKKHKQKQKKHKRIFFEQETRQTARLFRRDCKTQGAHPNPPLWNHPNLL